MKNKRAYKLNWFMWNWNRIEELALRVESDELTRWAARMLGCKRDRAAFDAAQELYCVANRRDPATGRRLIVGRYLAEYNEAVGTYYNAIAEAGGLKRQQTLILLITCIIGGVWLIGLATVLGLKLMMGSTIL